MNLQVLPSHVRTHVYLFWTGMATAGLGIIGFFLSFTRIVSPKVAAVAVNEDIPEVAYASIFAWVIGLALMWYSRRRLDAAVAGRLADGGGNPPVEADSGQSASILEQTADAPAGRDT